MARILAVDYGEKRCGIAVSDPMKIIANGLTTVGTADVEKFIVDYCAKEDVETIVVGYPKTLRNEPAAVTAMINPFIGRLRTWNENRTLGDIEGALDSVSALLKSMVLETPGIASSVAAGNDAVLYTSLVHRVAERCARYICESTVVDFAKYHEILIDNVFETFYVLISGLIMYIRMHNDVSQETVKEIIACTLHIEGYTKKYQGRLISG